MKSNDMKKESMSAVEFVYDALSSQEQLRFKDTAVQPGPPPPKVPTGAMSLMPPGCRPTGEIGYPCNRMDTGGCQDYGTLWVP